MTEMVKALSEAIGQIAFDYIVELEKEIDELKNVNAHDKSKKNKTYNLKEFAEIKQLIEKINYVEIDRYIDNENVVTPNKIKLNIVENNGKFLLNLQLTMLMKNL